MGKDVDIAREHSFLDEMLTKIQELETDEKVKQQLLKQYKSHAAKEDLQLDKKLLECILIDLLLKNYQDSNEVIGVRLPDTMKILNVKDLVNLQKQRLTKKLVADIQISETKESSQNHHSSNRRPLLTHTPQSTSKFLRQFKFKEVGSEFNSGLKELVHAPTDPDYSIADYKKTLENASKSLRKAILPNTLYWTVKELIDLMSVEGLEIYEKNNEHPYCFKSQPLKDHVLKKYNTLTRYNKKYPFIPAILKQFKQNYRCAEEGSEATVLRNLILNTFVRKKYIDTNKGREYTYAETLIRDEQKIFLKFSDNINKEAIFCAWLPNIKSLLHKMADDFLKHRGLERTVHIWIESTYNDFEDVTKIELHILNKESQVHGMKPRRIYKSMQEYERDLKAVCDWRIEADYTDGSSKRLTFFNDTPSKIEDCEKVGGFKHILTFYD